MFNKRVLFIALTVVALLAVLAGVSVGSGFTEDVRTAYTERTVDFLSDEPIFSKHSLEELILGSDVIAVVTLESVSRGVEKQKLSNPSGSYSQTGYVKSLEFHFEVEQYLKGQDADRITGLVLNMGSQYNTAAGAMLGKPPDQDRKTDWDDRKAVVFLRDDGKDPEVNWKTGRYWMAVTTPEDDYYSIASFYRRPWLPAVSDSADEQTFLLESDVKGRTTPPETITLDDLKGRISFMEQKIVGRSEQYRRCVVSQLHWHGRESQDTTPYKRDDVAIWSGLPGGAHFFTSPVAPYILQARHDNPLQPGQKDAYVLDGKDKDYFKATTPGYISLARPLPAGDYRIYHAHFPWGLGAGCGGTVPEPEMRRLELFIKVGAPEGTLHEAFLDPVEDGKGVVAAGGTVGVLEPATFSDANGAPATIQRIAWEGEAGGVGTVKITLSPHDSVAGHTVEFIALDGSVSLSLAAAEAQVDAANGTLTWKVESQPWRSGDKLMLRVSAAVS